MKRLFSIIVLLIALFVFVSCGETKGPVGEKGLAINAPDTIRVGDQVTLTLEMTGIDNPELSWIVSDESIASINNGVLTGLKEGKVTVAVTENVSGMQVTALINVVKAEVKTKSLLIIGDVVCKVGQSITLTAKYDTDATVNLEWKSSDENIATISNGVVNAISKGKVTITLTDKVSGLSKELKIEIASDVITIDDMLDWAFEQTGTESLDDVEFPTSNPETGATFEWSTDSPDMLNIEEGYVEFTEIDEVVKLTCKATFNGQTKERTIDFTVLGYAAYDVYREFMKQFKGNQIFGDMVDMERYYNLYGGSTVEIHSHNKDIFDDDGKLTKQFYEEEVNVTLIITMTKPAFKKSIDVKLTAKALDSDERKELVKKWIETNVTPDGYIYKTTVLPSYIDDYGTSLTWLKADGGTLNLDFSADNPILGDNLGVVIKISCEDGAKYSMEMSFKVSVTPITDMWEKLELFVNTISMSEVSAFNYLLINWSGYSSGYVPFVTEKELPIIEDILPYTDGNSRTGILKSSTEYIVVHDTGSPSAGANATMHNNYIKRLNQITDPNDPNDRVVSWHFTIDDELCYQHLPLDEVGWHAGDGSHRYGDVYTNSTYKKTDCIGGGNYNGIGIESCVHNGTDYTYTMRRLAKLVAGLLVKYNLGIDRVKQHWHFSGKNCPQVMRESNRWNELIYLIKLEYYCMTELKGATFEWTSLTPDIMDNEGRIKGKQPNNTTVSYKVKVTYNGTSKEYTYSSVLKVR